MIKALKLLKKYGYLINQYTMDLVSNDIHEAIAELEALIEKDKSKKCEECYRETNKVLALVEQRESDAKHTIIKLIRELEELENRSCRSCKHCSDDCDEDGEWYCEERIKHIELDFYCKRHEAKEV